MKVAGVGRRYARALLEAVPEAQQDVVDKRLGTVAQVFQSAPAGPVLHNPGIADSVKQEIARQILDDEAYIYPLIAVLLEHGRVSMLPDVAREYHRLYLAARGRVEAHVRTAKEIGRGQQDAIVRHLSKRVGKTVEAEFGVDPALIGGMEIRMADELWDGSVKGRLQRLRTALLDEVTTGEA